MVQLQEGTERLLELDPASILPNPSQPRRTFDEDELFRLADSITRYGILQPLTVRRRKDGGRVFYELIAGERRMRAAVIAGLSRVPCRVIEADDERSAEMAVIENLLRRDLSLFEEASAISYLLEEHGVTQETLAERLSVSQSYVANKLRLLRLSEEEQNAVLSANLTERHCRALLRITDETERGTALAHIIRHGYNVEKTEAYIDELLEKRDTPRHKKRIKGALGDLRIFYNSIDRAIHFMRGAGMNAKYDKVETEDGVDLTIHIEKKKNRVP